MHCKSHQLLTASALSPARDGPLQVEATLPLGPIEPPVVHPPNCSCGACRSSMPVGAAPAVPQLSAEEADRIVAAGRLMPAATEALWRGFMSSMRRPPRGLLQGRQEGGATSAPAVASLCGDGVTGEDANRVR